MVATEEDLKDIHEIGEKIAQSVVSYFQKDKAQTINRPIQRSRCQHGV